MIYDSGLRFVSRVSGFKVMNQGQWVHIYIYDKIIEATELFNSLFSLSFLFLRIQKLTVLHQFRLFCGGFSQKPVLQNRELPAFFFKRVTIVKTVKTVKTVKRGGTLGDEVTSQTQAIQSIADKRGKTSDIEVVSIILLELLRVYVLKGGQLRLELRNFVCLRFNVAWFGDQGLGLFSFGFRAQDIGLKFRVWGFGVKALGFRVQDYESRSQRLGLLGAQGVVQRIQGVEIRMYGLEFRIWGSGFRIQASQFQASGFRLMIQGLGIRDKGSQCRVQGQDFRVQNSGFRGQSLGMRFWGFQGRVWRLTIVVEGLGFRIQYLGSRIQDLGSQVDVQSLRFRVSGLQWFRFQG